jgi:hypothetical protein
MWAVPHHESAFWERSYQLIELVAYLYLYEISGCVKVQSRIRETEKHSKDVKLGN